MEIIAHRGASYDAPENTLAAVRLAWAQNADAVEVDVHLTRDGRLAVIHDSDTQRTTRTARVVADAELTELGGLDAGSWKAPAFSGERIPSLDAVLAFVPRGKRVFIELKAGPGCVPALSRCFASSPLSDEQGVIISFDLATAGSAKRQLPGCEVCWIVEKHSAEGRREISDLVRSAKAAGLDGIDVEGVWVDAEWRRLLSDAGLKLYVWTVDHPELARRLIAVGVDGITTNRPGWLRGQLNL